MEWEYRVGVGGVNVAGGEFSVVSLQFSEEFDVVEGGGVGGIGCRFDLEGVAGLQGKVVHDVTG